MRDIYFDHLRECWDLDLNFVPVCHDIYSIFTIKCLVSGQNLGRSRNLKYTYILFGLRRRWTKIGSMTLSPKNGVFSRAVMNEKSLIL